MRAMAPANGSFAAGAARAFRSPSHESLPPLDGLANLTGAWSMGRDLLTTFIGSSRYTDSSGAVSQLTDQTGSAHHLTQGTSGNRPAVATGGASSRACALFDGTNDYLAGAAISNHIANNNGYIIASCIPLTIDTNNTTNYFYNDVLFCDAGGYMGAFMRSNGNAVGFNYDTNQDVAQVSGVSTSNPIVLEWRHEGGNVYIRVNGSSWQSAASGNTGSVTGLLQLGRTLSGTTYTNLKFFDMASFNSVPNDTIKNALAADFLAWIS